MISLGRIPVGSYRYSRRPAAYRRARDDSGDPARPACSGALSGPLGCLRQLQHDASADDGYRGRQPGQRLACLRSAPALMALCAEVEITGRDGKRRLPLEEFFVGPGKTALQEVNCSPMSSSPGRRPEPGAPSSKSPVWPPTSPKPAPPWYWCATESRIVDAGWRLGRSGRRLCALGRPSRCCRPGVARSSSAGRPDGCGEVTPIDDVRSEAWYRREMVRVLTYDGLQRAWQRAEWPLGGKEGCAPREPRRSPAGRRQNRIDANERRWIELNVNGEKLQAWVGPNDLLLNVMRDQLQLTGTKYGCGIGECSACTVQMDGNRCSRAWCWRFRP